MASRPQATLAQRLVTVATALMAPSRRDWGRARSAELACETSAAGRVRLVLAAIRIAALAPPGLAAALPEYARAAGRAAAVAMIGYVPIGLVLYVLNVVIPPAQVAVPGVVAWGYPLVVLGTAGARARRGSARTSALVVAGLIAGLVLALLSVATVALLDIHADLELLAPIVIAVAAVAGAVFAPLGPALAAALTSAATRSPARRHRIPGRK